MVLFYSITVNEYQNTCKSKREKKKKELFPFSCNCLFNQWSFLQKNIKQFSIKRNTMYNVMLLFFRKKNSTYQNVYTELRMLVCR